MYVVNATNVICYAIYSKPVMQHSCHIRVMLFKGYVLLSLWCHQGSLICVKLF